MSNVRTADPAEQARAALEAVDELAELTLDPDRYLQAVAQGRKIGVEQDKLVTISVAWSLIAITDRLDGIVFVLGRER